VLLSSSTIMTKPAIALAILGVLGSTAVAGKPHPIHKKSHVATKPAPAPLKKPNCGESYDLFAPSRHAATPAGDVTLAAKKTLTQQQVDEVARTKLDDVEFCWNRLPAKQRKADATAILKLAIDATGEVETVDVGGLVPAEASRCIAVAAAKWQFPVADQSGDFEYAVALRAM
jgi:hypothetical protein